MLARKLNWIAGGANGSGLLIRTVPRPSGRKCTGLNVKAENGCGLIPVRSRSSALHPNMLICRSGCFEARVAFDKGAGVDSGIRQMARAADRVLCTPAMTFSIGLRAMSLTVTFCEQRHTR